MCGITGFWQAVGENDTNLQNLARIMAAQMVARGPDDCAEWSDEGVGLAFGFRRLAILDLSPQGRQPMLSESGRYVIVFNGEVYNFLELRQQLEVKGHHFRGGSDTEVILAAIEEWGVAQAASRFVGMFALALWDRSEHALHLVRDRLGIKPLYYGWMGNAFIFGSELKSLRIHPQFCRVIDHGSLALLMRHCYIPSPYSIYQNVYKLLPGTILTLDSNQADQPSPVRFWDAKQVTEEGVAHPFRGSEKEAIEQLDALLSEAIKMRMIADVPLGALLSGGIDSSTVVALMQAQSNRPIKTFTIGFHEKGYDEANSAAKIASYLGTEHTPIYVTPEQAMEVIPEIPTIYDEPFSDSSQIPTFLVSKLARSQVTVALSGDGGDELFAGYNRYFAARNIWNYISSFPSPVRRVSTQMLRLLSAEVWDGIFERIKPIAPAGLRLRLTGHNVYRVAALLADKVPDEMYRDLVSQRDSQQLILQTTEPITVLNDPSRWANLSDFTQRMMYLDLVSYLPGDILTKVDRASMAVSLEARVPLLDHRVVEFAWTLPMSMKIKDNKGKWILRQVLGKYVPPELTERPKMGFGIPLHSWLRGPLREWAEHLLNEARLQQGGFFDSAPISQKWAEHLAGTHDWKYHLWNVLMFQAWLEVWG